MLKDDLGQPLGRRFTMFPLSQYLKIAAGAAIIALSAGNHLARADELAQHLGPVGPHEPILATFGNKHAIAFYEPDNGRCAVDAVVYEKTDADTGMTTATRFRISLNPREVVHIDSTDNKTLSLQCGDYADTLSLADELSVVDTEQEFASK
jgi:hypothetical protein